MSYTVLVDTREHNEEIIRAIKESGCGVIKTKLEVGDYSAGGFIFERKSVSDFVNSIIDGRLFSQLERLRNSEMRSVVIIEGDLWRELQHRDVSPNAVLGAQLAIYTMGVCIIHTADPIHTGSLLC
ncbi:MAG: ERCC4 domain-containing protein, partial [Pyrobaculum sp.]